MIKIRQIEADDMARVVPMAKSFFVEAKLHGEFNRDSFVLGWMRLLRSGSGMVFALETDDGRIVGAIAAVASEDLNTGDKVAVEMFYYAMPETRGHALRLLAVMEESALGRGCKRIWMIHLEDERAGRMQKFYERRGYSIKEHLYMKELL